MKISGGGSKLWGGGRVKIDITEEYKLHIVSVTVGRGTHTQPIVQRQRGPESK